MSNPPTAKQIDFAETLAAERGLDLPAACEAAGVDLSSLTRFEASALIDWLLAAPRKPDLIPLVDGDAEAAAAFDALNRLFGVAAGALKYPKLRFELADGRKVKLYRAGDRARVPGSINVLIDEDWHGRILADGSFEASRKSCQPETVEFLRELATDPAGVAANEGRRTGRCCFCARLLTDGRSVAAGYGPVCAVNWGLPWGDKPSRPEAAEAEAAELAAANFEPVDCGWGLV